MEEQADKFREQKKNNGLLLVAASRGYLPDVEALLEMGAALDAKDKQGRSPLHFAAAQGRENVVRFLWSRGAEVDADTPDGRTPLHLAALGGHAEAATFLLQKGAWGEAYDAADDTPLHMAARHGHTGVIEALLRHGTKPGAANKQGLTPLACALVGGHVAAAKLLQGWGASLGDKPHGYSLLHLAAGVGALPSVTFLLDTGADPNERSNAEGATPLHSAALGGCARCTEALLAAGGDAGLADAEGQLPADMAEDARVKELLKPKSGAKGAKPAAKPRSGGAAAEGGPLPAQEQFRALSQAERLRKVERLALMDDADLAAALRQYPAEPAAQAAARIAQLQATRKLLNIHKALAALHSDEDFQADAAQPHVRAAIDAIRADTSKYERYTADLVILAVLQKMRRLHSVAQANGQRTVSIDDMLAQPGQEQRDAERQQAIEATCAAHLAAAAAAAASEGGGGAAAAAQAAYDSTLKAAKEAAISRAARAKTPEAAPGGSGTAKVEGVGKAAGAASILRQRIGGGSGTGGGDAKRGSAGAKSSTGGAVGAAAAQAAAATEAAGQALEDQERRSGETEEDANLPEWMKGEFRWKKVWAEFWKQTKAALTVLALFLLVAWVVRGRAPWAP